MQSPVRLIDSDTETAVCFSSPSRGEGYLVCCNSLGSGKTQGALKRLCDGIEGSAPLRANYGRLLRADDAAGDARLAAAELGRVGVGVAAFVDDESTAGDVGELQARRNERGFHFGA